MLGMQKKRRICLLVFLLTLGLVTACSKGGKKSSKDETNTNEVSSEELTTTEEPSDRIIVTLGDSYAAGEGIEPFYGQLSKDLAETDDYFGKFSGMFSAYETSPDSEKVQNEDWLAHRSQYAWSGMLTLPGVEGNMAENRGTHWYFKAVSGAVTHNIIGYDVDEKGNKNYDKYIDHILDEEKDCKQLKEANRNGEKNTVNLEPQIKVFDELAAEGKKADYVIISIGGNDVGFGAVVAQVMVGSWYFDTGNLEEMVDNAKKLVGEGGVVREDLKRTYREVAEAAGPQATLIVVGYPELYDRYGKGTFVAKDEAWIVDDAVLIFNKEIESIVKECRAEGINIEYVSVVEPFGTIDAEGNIIDPQHQAYSDDEYIQSITIGAKDEDLQSNDVFSSYSMHPNLSGALAYAVCVQKKIDELEAAKGRLGDGLDPKYKAAYLAVLEHNKEAIEAYSRQFKDGSASQSTASDGNTSKPVALQDICGDGTPELIFVTADTHSSIDTHGQTDAEGVSGNSDMQGSAGLSGTEGSSAVLHIFTYKDGGAVEIYSCDVDSAVEGTGSDKTDGAPGYLLFSTKFTRELYLFCGSTDPLGKASYKKLSLEDDKLVAKPVISYETIEEKSEDTGDINDSEDKGESGESGEKEGSDKSEQPGEIGKKKDKVTTNYKYKDSDISKKEYEKVEKKLLFAAKDIVLSDDEYSEYMTKGDSFDPSGNVSMTYDEAVRKLK